MLRAVPIMAAGIFSLERPIPFPVNEDLPIPECPLLPTLPNPCDRAIARRGLVEEECVSVLRLRLRKRLALRTASISEAVRTATPMGLGLHACKAGLAAHGFQLGHRQFAGSPDIHRAQQGNISRHVRYPASLIGLPQGPLSPIYSPREVGSRRVPRQPGQVRKEAALTSVSRVARPASHLAPSVRCVAALPPLRSKPFA